MIKNKSGKVLMLLLIAISSMVVVTFAYFSQVFSGWEHTISSTSLTFLFNKHTFGDTITKENLNLVRGEEADLELLVEVTSNQKNVKLGYSITLTLDDDADNGLAPAIECYILEKGTYRFLGMLNDITGYDGNAETPDSGYVIQGYLPASFSYSYDLKFVYSPGAGDKYENKSFNVTAAAQIEELNFDQFDYVFAHDIKTLTSAVSLASNANKTVYLLSNIELINDMTISTPVSIDLKGFEIKARTGSSPKLIIEDTTENGKTFTGHGIFNSAINKGGIGIPVEVNLPYGFYAIDCPVEENNVTVTDFSVKEAATYIQKSIDTYGNIIFKTGDKYDVFVGVALYIKTGVLKIEAPSNLFGQAGSRFEIVPVRENNKEVVKLTIGYGPYPETVGLETEFTLTKLVGGSFAGESFAGGLTVVRGSSLESIAQALMKSIPNRIVGSILLPAKDQVTGANITWIIPSQYETYIDNQGVFLRDGYENLINWEDVTFEIGVKVSLNGEQYSYYKEKTVSVADSLTAEKRTALIYSNRQIVLQTETINFSLLEEINELLSISGLVSIETSAVDFNAIANSDYLKLEETIGIVNPNIGEDEPKFVYHKISELSETEIKELMEKGGVKCFTLTVVKIPQKAFLNLENIKITFTYELSGGTKISCDIIKDITVLGIVAEYEVNDTSSFIQAEFDSNNYIHGLDKSFYVSGNVKSGVLVEFVVDKEFEDFISIRNDIYLPVAGIDSGNIYFVKIVENAEGEVSADTNGTVYAFFNSNSRYDEMDSEDISSDGRYVDLVLFDGAVKKYKRVNIDELIDASNLFVRKALVTVLYEFVPPYNLTAIIRARLYSLINIGNEAYGERNKVYKYDSEGNQILDKFMLAIRGIYHFKPTEIADYSVYLALIKCYDYNGNGYIECEEAELEPLTVGLTSYAPYGYAINLASKNIQTIKGVEYFPKIPGFNFSGNTNLSDLSYLSSLSELKYLNFNNNNIADLLPLTYLDNLRYLNLRANSIPTLEPIKYLPNIEYLDIGQNPNISDFSFIGEYKNLTYLYVVQDSGDYTNTTDSMYYFALIAANNPGASIYIVGTGVWNFSAGEKAAAKAMSELVVATQVGIALYAPTSYSYGGNQYKLEWYTESFEKIQFIYENGEYTGEYTIISPIVQEIVKISLRVYRFNSTTGNYEWERNISRSERLTLLPSVIADDSYIETAPGVYVRAEEVVPDSMLLSKLFTVFNKNDSDTIPPGAPVSQKYLITWAELHPAVKVDYMFDWSSSGIRNLTGIEVFAELFNVANSTINLTNNSIGDLTPLRALTALKVLTLGGQRYDFSQLVTFSVDENGYFDTTVPAGGLINLTRLNVYGSYGLTEYNMLKDLFAVYLSNNYKNGNLVATFDVYIVNAATKWTPLASALEKESQKLPKVYTAKELGNIYLLADQGRSLNAVVYDLWKLEIVVSSIAAVSTPPQADSSGSSVSGYFTVSVSPSAYISYNKLVGYTQAFFTIITLNGGGTTLSFRIQIAVNVNDNIILEGINSSSKYYNANTHVTSGSKSGMPLTQIFSGRSALSQVMGQLTAARLGTPTADGYYFVSQVNLTAWITGSTLNNVANTLLVDGSYMGDSELGLRANGEKRLSIDGLEFTGIKSLFFLRDAVFGDGSSLSKIETIITSKGADFTTIKVTMPALKHLYVGLSNTFVRGAYVMSVFGSDSLGYMPNLETLALNISQTLGYDWSFLRAIANKATNTISTLYLVASDSGQLASAATLAIVNDIYWKSTAATKNYTIAEVPFTGSGSDPTDIYIIEATKEYAEFASMIYDLGVKSDMGYYAGTNKQSYSENETIYLPYSTHSVSLGITVEDNTILNRAFLINWRIYGVFDQQTFDSLFILNGATVTFTGLYAQLVPLDTATYDGYITLKCRAADYYTLIRGEIGTGYFELVNNAYKLTAASRTLVLGTTYRFLYPAYVHTLTSTNPSISGGFNSKVGATHFSYSMFKDSTFRQYMFMGTLFSGGIGGNTTAAGYGSGYKGAQPNNIASINFAPTTTTSFSFTAFNATNANATVNAFSTANLNSIVNLTSYVYSFEGIENFTRLQSLTHTSGLLSKIPNLRGTQITTVSLSNNLIENLDAFAGCTNLTTLDVSTNPLNDISGLLTATNLQTLTMHTCPSLTVNMMEPLRNNGSITSISLYNCLGLAKLEMLEILNSMTALSTFRLNSSSTAASKSTIDTFLLALQSVNIQNALNNGIYVGDLSNTILSGVGGVRAYVDANVSDSNIKYFFPNNIDVPLIVTNDGQISVRLTTKLLNESAITYTMNGYTAENFDPVLWAYFAKTYSNGTGSFNVPTTLTITSNINLTSLKGLELLSLITVIITTNPLEELWTGRMQSLTSLYLNNTVLTTETIYRALRLAPNLKSLNLRGVAGIDYYEEFEAFTFGGTVYEKGNIANTTLNRLASGGLVAVGFNFVPTTMMEEKNIHSWNDYLVELFSGHFFLELNNSSFAGSTYQLNVSTVNSQTVYYANKSLHSVTSGNAIFRYYTITSPSTMKFSYAHYYYNSSGSGTSSSISYAILTASQRVYSVNFTTASNVSRDIFPNRSGTSAITFPISYDTIAANGGIIKFNLPSSISMYRTDSVYYTLSFGSVGIPVSIISVTGEFYMHLYYSGGNYYIKDIAGNAGPPIAVTDNSFTFTIQARSNFISNTAAAYTLTFQVMNIPTSTVYDYNYYIEIEEGNFELASNHIKSMGLLYYMYEVAAMRNLFVTTTTTEDGAIRPNTITAASRTAVTTTAVSIGSTAATSYQIASLDGLELFTGLRSITVGIDCAVTSFEPLRGLSLTTFRNYQSYYASTLGGTYYSSVPIMDYSPIYDGESRTTITTLALAYYSNTAMNDVSFLLNMPALTSVSMYYSVSGTAANNYYIYTPAFRYVVATLRNRGASVSFSANTTYPVAAPTAEELVSANIMEHMSSTRNLIYSDEFKLLVQESARNADETYNLPGMIEFNGKIAILEWREAYGHAEVDKYTSNLSQLSSNNVYQTVLNRSYTSSTIKMPNGSPRKFEAGLNILTYDELMLLTQEAGFISMCVTGEVEITIKVSFDFVRATNKNITAILVAKSVIDGIGAERMLTIVNHSKKV